MKIKTDEGSVLNALHEATETLWFDDNADYGAALYNVIKHLSPELYENIGEDEIHEEHIKEIEDAQKLLTTGAASQPDRADAT